MSDWAILRQEIAAWHAAALVSMCRYNTTMDILQTGVPAARLPVSKG